MGAHDKVSNKIDDVAGKAKEGLGKATGDDKHRNRRQARPGEVQPQGRRREGEGRLQEVTTTSQHRGRPPEDPTPVVFRFSRPATASCVESAEAGNRTLRRGNDRNDRRRNLHRAHCRSAGAAHSAGRQSIGVIMTILLGAIGSFVGSWVTYRLIYHFANQGRFALTAVPRRDYHCRHFDRDLRGHHRPAGHQDPR